MVCRWADLVDSARLAPAPFQGGGRMATVLINPKDATQQPRQSTNYSTGPVDSCPSDRPKRSGERVDTSWALSG
jgi:hypothetical protein